MQKMFQDILSTKGWARLHSVYNIIPPFRGWVGRWIDGWMEGQMDG